MKTKIICALGTCLAMLLSFVACDEQSIDPVVDPVVDPVEPYLTIQESVELPASGVTTRIELKSNTTWAFEGGASWLNVDPLSGENDKRIALTPEENISVNSRTCTLTVCTDDGSVIRDITVTQLGTEAVLEAAVLGNMSPEKDSEISVEIKSNESWTIECEASWLRINQVSGSGNAVVKITALTTNYSQDDRSEIIKIKSSNLEKELVVTQTAAWVKNCNVNINQDYVVFSDDIAFTCEASGDVLRYHYYFVTKDEVNINNIGALTSHILEMSTDEGYYADPNATKEADRIHCFDGMLMDDTEYVLFVIAVNSEGLQGGMTSLEFKTGTFDVEKEPYAMIYRDEIYWDSSYSYLNIPVIPNGVTSYYYTWTTTDPERISELSYSQIGYISQNEIKNNPNDFVKNAREWTFEVEYTTYLMFVVWAVGTEGRFGGVFDGIYWAPNGTYSVSGNREIKKIDVK